MVDSETQVESRTQDHVQFDALRNAVYHSARLGYYDAWHRWTNLVVVASGALAVTDLLASYIDLRYLAAVAALAGLSNLVFDFAGKARSHENLQRQFHELLAEITSARDVSDAQISSWDSKLHRLYAGEPPIMRAVDAVAYNNATESLDRDPDSIIAVVWWQSVLRHLLPFNGTVFETRKEKRERKSGGAEGATPAA